MTDYSNWKVLKSVLDYKGDDEEKIAQARAAQEEYTDVSIWCDDNPYTIVEEELYCRTQKVEPYVPTEDELKASVRSVRDRYLQHYDFTQLPDAPFTELEKAQYADYRQYLRDYTTLPNWWLANPKTFEEWSAE